MSREGVWCDKRQPPTYALLAQSVEHFHGKEGVTSSSLVEGLSDSILNRSRGMWRRFLGAHANAWALG